MAARRNAGLDALPSQLSAGDLVVQAGADTGPEEIAGHARVPLEFGYALRIAAV